VVAVQTNNETEANQPKRSGDWASDTGVMRILGDYVPPPSTRGRRCGACGTTNPEGASICENCNSKLIPEETSHPTTVSRGQVASDESPEPVRFREVDKLAFEDVPVRRVIRPRREIVFLDINDSLEQMQGQVRDTMHSRYPVCDRSLDKTLGVVHIKDILVAETSDLDIRPLLESPDEIPDTTPVSKVLQHFQNDGVPMAFVVDEYANMIGIVTLKDVLSKLAQPGR
jgi:CBS domain-containing protein